MKSALAHLTRRDDRYDGVRRVHVYALRLLYALMFFLLGQTTWTEILTHSGPWTPDEGVAWSVWAAFATLAGLGIIHPIRMLPIILLEIFYKVLWLILVAYPLWTRDALAGSSAEGLTQVFVPVILPILIVPWGYVATNYLVPGRRINPA
jgi:hypothetical protein